MIEIRKAKLAVIGLGFVGLPLSVTLAEKGFHVYGIDVDKNKVSALNNMTSYIDDISHSRVRNVIKENLFYPTVDFDVIKDADAIIVCVPTPLTSYKTPDLTYVINAGMEISKRLKRNQLVVLESSTFPGTTKEILLPILEKKSLKAGEDFFLAYSPERIDPGNKAYDMSKIPKVIGGVTENCKDAAYHLYSEIYDHVVPVSSTEAAELTKLLENIYRFINISFINEMAVLSDQLKVNIWEVIDAAATKPYGFSPFYPGPGIGGHCIPVDPLYLQWKLQQYEESSDFIKLSDSMNERMVQYIVNRTKDLLLHSKNFTSSNILLYGVTYKKDVADTRDSTAVEILEKFKKEGASISYHDPFVPELKVGDQLFKSVELDEMLKHRIDCVVILTDHSQIPLNLLIEHADIVFDTRNVTKDIIDRSKIVRLGGGENL
ncbi:nucleotide sugar dehydrogenase [Bacillus sp. V2I10]|uniref:nucleotide sugar dehydrogenase n=1 Tax=Bacillus sp. V2I10 TaxID=3042276 RepID=UPI00278016EF|nr:nucleotide sugar dehydrogenase [Bacillus sp. V2I10]MDQ0859364.1 UDP-N-acetyl-D-glucosamine dehydrogenase [Bacillus sp. V2I10]